MTSARRGEQEMETNEEDDTETRYARPLSNLCKFQNSRARQSPLSPSRTKQCQVHLTSRIVIYVLATFSTCVLTTNVYDFHRGCASAFSPQIKFTSTTAITTRSKPLNYFDDDSFRIRRRKQWQRRTMGCFYAETSGGNSSNNGKERSLFEILNDEVSELILDKLNQKWYGGGRDQTQSESGTTSDSNSNSNMWKKESVTFQPSTAGLSKFHRSIVASATKRQRCVTGQYPLLITIAENPTRKWLSSTSNQNSSRNNNNINSRSSSSSFQNSAASSQMLVNGTSVDRSLASYDRFQWLDDDERMKLQKNYALLSLELVAEINVKKPGYVNIMDASAAGASATQRKRLLEENMNSGSGGRGWVNPWKNKGRNAVGVDGMFGTGIAAAALAAEEFGQMDTDDAASAANKERLWITGFSLTKQSGEMHYVNVGDGTMGHVNGRTASAIRWPNEVNSVPVQGYNYLKNYGSTNEIHSKCTTKTTNIDKSKKPNKVSQLEDSLLVSDGFLVPGRDNGGLYLVSRPGHDEAEWKVCLAGGNGVEGVLSKLESASVNSVNDVGDVDEDGWFYHRSIWVDLTGDGRQSILTARAKRPSILKSTSSTNAGRTSSPSSQSQNDDSSLPPSSNMPTKAQLVWLERPQPYKYDESTGTPLDVDGLVFDPFSSRNTPWKVRVLDEGPDVMFSVADLDTTDDTIEIIASQFFNRKLTLHSIRRGPEPKVVFRRTLDDRCGASFSSIFADLNGVFDAEPTARVIIDSGSTVPTLKPGDQFSHLLVTSHECTFAEEDDNGRAAQRHTLTLDPRRNDDSFKSEVRMGSSDDEELHSTASTSASATVKSPIDGGSLFSYKVPVGKDAWKTEPWTRSIIATGFRVKGQLGNMINPGAPGFCYTFYPTKEGSERRKDSFTRPLIGISGDCAEAAYILRPVDKETGGEEEDASANYAMMCEIDCGATVGSIGIGYEDFCFAEQQNGYAKLYVPCYERDKVLVFAMGNGEDDDMIDGW